MRRDCLSDEEALRLGFPSIEMEIDVEGCSWDSSVYEGLRKFHKAKGFDPDSQEVAIHVGDPLYEPCLESRRSFACGEKRLILLRVIWLTIDVLKVREQNASVSHFVDPVDAKSGPEGSDWILVPIKFEETNGEEEDSFVELDDGGAPEEIKLNGT
ncbi:hypothetical protein FB45DRAFT_1032196 [Roridomyces roridus]|uniref:Uncharacterized protein n=1 Tax=Roridomyces roridus TaxID=1738132 RepID=A0AAD7BJC5_9AGAR|nr:hypothetical protein FB45DRAFT_1032196 [Roridomyces roridus]